MSEKSQSEKSQSEKSQSEKSQAKKTQSGKSQARAADPRPARTRAALWNALLELMQEKRWERITVQDVLDRTGLGRSTFYAHFDNKFDLLTASIPQIVLPITSANDLMPDLQPLFDHVEEMQPLFRPLLNQPLLGEITDVFHSQLATAWAEHLQSRGTGDRTDMLAQFLAGGFMAVCREWINDRCALSSTEVCEQFTRIATAMIRQEAA